MSTCVCTCTLKVAESLKRDVAQLHHLVVFSVITYFATHTELRYSDLTVLFSLSPSYNQMKTSSLKEINNLKKMYLTIDLQAAPGWKGAPNLMKLSAKSQAHLRPLGSLSCSQRSPEWTECVWAQFPKFNGSIRIICDWDYLWTSLSHLYHCSESCDTSLISLRVGLHQSESFRDSLLREAKWVFLWAQLLKPGLFSRVFGKQRVSVCREPALAW